MFYVNVIKMSSTPVELLLWRSSLSLPFVASQCLPELTLVSLKTL